MAYYEELDTIISVAISELLNNKSICKYLYYYPNEVNFQYNPLIQPDIESPKKELLMKKIFPLPKEPDAKLNQDCFINVIVNGGKINQNTGFRYVTLIFEVVCHLDSWIVKGGYRPIKIMSEIDKIFNNKNVEGLPIHNKPQPQPTSINRYSDKFYGYRVAYDLIISSNVGC